jgi:hypothetical protein
MSPYQLFARTLRALCDKQAKGLLPFGDIAALS